jgi:hypothetical protein
MNAFIARFKSIRSNPFFVTAWTLFAGAIGKEVVTTIQTGNVDLSARSVESMLFAAGGITAVALIHLYLPQPNPTVPAMFPPSKTLVDVPAQLEPVDPKAVPILPPK